MLKHSFKKKPYLPYIAPAMTIMTVLTVFPTIFLYVISVTNYQLGWDLSRVKFVWFNNYLRLFSGGDPDFWNAVYISLLFMVITTVIEMVFGFFIGKLLCDTEFKLKPVVFAILIVPIVMTPSIAGNIWKLMLNSEYGIINYFLNQLGIPNVAWLDADKAFTSVVLADVWQWTPFVALISYAGLCSLPSDQYEAARIDGGNAFQLFRYITLPSLRPLIFLTMIFRTIDSLKIYDMPFVLTQGGPGNSTEFLSLHIYRLANAQNGLIGRAAANAIVLMVISTCISKVLIHYQRKEA
ncbi:carbohydrate ABC transporter permease [Lacrimispora sp. 210928-DFI.3.58]|uniref:carbohydrate ABC transporter permease n=1 Tax=Lacrimispora sp. 210928-DFI.3.58 TaxID=2883214 RepID=UPI0015B7260C|nr:ABC transporter permease subunit [Lacrimispora sp. 210928-DFI.3.58]MCB7319202.1 sugar ABC transporter permease [Lacrimispora sp. 210928-DFI.3.58]